VVFGAYDSYPPNLKGHQACAVIVKAHLSGTAPVASRRFLIPIGCLPAGQHG